MRALATILGVLVAPALAIADDDIARGSVVKIEAQEVYISVGVDRGVTGGSAVRLKRPVSLKHPITRATVQDWIPIGSASVTQAGAVMSRAVVGDMVTAIKVGDIAEVLVDRPDSRKAPEPVAPVPAPTGPQAPAIDPATQEVLGLFAAQANQPIETRIAAWERYLSTRANSPFAAAIRRDLDELHRLRDEMLPPTTSRSTETRVSVGHTPPKSATMGMQIPVVFVLDQPDRVASAYLHYRPRGNRTYKSMLLVREHDIYLRGTLPAEAVKAPGLDYFVEVSTSTGASGLAIGTPREPIAVDVANPTMLDRFGSLPGRSSVKLAIDYLDFAQLDRRDGDRTDRMVTGNVDFTYRFDSWVESVGVGYGVYAGSGGYTDGVWDAANPIPRSGFHYGYADMEVGGHTDEVHISAGGQLIAGVGKDGFGMGAEGRFRIGDREGTNLAIIGRTISQVGFVSDIRFGARPIDKLLLGISVGATDQPNRGDVGVKLGTELEILAGEHVSVLLRGSWQGRSTKHGGLGAGGGLGFYW
jgi:hypothetical protein